MSRLADYFAVIGIPKASSTGIYQFYQSPGCLLNKKCIYTLLCRTIISAQLGFVYVYILSLFDLLDGKKELNGKVLQRFPSQDRKDVFPEGLEMVL